jgi:hypothetical protein
MEGVCQQGFSFIKRQVLENIVDQFEVTGRGAAKLQEYDEKRRLFTVFVDYNVLVAVLSQVA